MEKAKQLYWKTRAKAISARFGNPSSGLKIIAVTGTSGKTTTASFINEILKEAGHTTGLYSTLLRELNGQSINDGYYSTSGASGRLHKFLRDAKRARIEYVVLEVTGRMIREQDLSGVLPYAAVMTNISDDHLGNHSTVDSYAEVRSRLFSVSPKFVVLNRDDEWFDYFDKFPAGAQKITYGKHEDAEARIEKIQLYRKGTEASVLIDHQTSLELATAMPGEFNAYNMVAAASLAYVIGVELEAIQEGVANLEPLPGRFERAAEVKGVDIVVDYARNPTALDRLLSSAKEITKGRLIHVFGAAGERDQDKRAELGRLSAKYADRIILTDEQNYTENLDEIRAMINLGIEEGRGGGKTTEVPDRRQAIEKALSIAKKGDTVIITGLGHQNYRILNGERADWSDSSEAAILAAELAMLENGEAPRE